MGAAALFIPKTVVATESVNMAYYKNLKRNNRLRTNSCFELITSFLVLM